MTGIKFDQSVALNSMDDNMSAVASYVHTVLLRHLLNAMWRCPKSFA